jgi:kynurenine formamidase
MEKREIVMNELYGTLSPVSMRVTRRHEDLTVEGPFGEATEGFTMSSHTGTHIDALCHNSEEIDGRPLLYQDIPAAEVASKSGFTQLGVEHCPPIIARGLLLDIPRSQGLDVLPDSCGITKSEIEGCCETEGIDIRPGDCVFIRTGLSKYRDMERDRFLIVGAGPAPEACRWLAEAGIVVTGSDTMSFEQVPSPHLGNLELIRRRGVPIIKQTNLDEIAANEVFEFLFIAVPLELVGATASPVSPIAVC